MAKLAARLSELMAAGMDDLPRPGGGDTLRRWQALAEVAAEDVALAKLFEGHTDALAILAECGGPRYEREATWGTWAAEPPAARLSLRPAAAGVVLTGRKAWCSGAGALTHALVTAWDPQGRQCLAAVALDHGSVAVTGDGWHAVGMGRVASGDVLFDGTPAVPVGPPGGYTARPGFWQGGCGVAACWYGAARPLADAVRALVARRTEPHTAAHLGAIDVAMQRSRALLVDAARWIDRHPRESAQQWALRVRGAAEATATEVLHAAGRALGAGPLCRDPAIAQRFADLPVFVRQSHAEQDLAVLGQLAAAGPGSDWALCRPHRGAPS